LFSTRIAILFYSFKVAGNITPKNPPAILADFGEHFARAPVRMDSNLQKQCCTNLLDWAQGIGIQTHAVVETMLGSRKHPQQSYRACLGVLSMAKAYGTPDWKPLATEHCD